jgi:hypothetical protein
MATSLPLWAIILAHLCNNWCNYTMMTSLPTYMKDVLKFDMKEVSMAMVSLELIHPPTFDFIENWKLFRDMQGVACSV